MSLKNRLILYGFGFSMGILFVLFIWKEKGTSMSWGLDARVIKNIQSKKLLIEINAQSILNEYQIDSSSLSSIISKSDVDFSKSETHTNPCKTYYLDTDYNQKNFTLIIKNCDSTATIVQILKE